MQLSGSEIILECLIREGVDVMFGYPGGAILPTYEAMSKYHNEIHGRRVVSVCVLQPVGRVQQTLSQD